MAEVSVLKSLLPSKFKHKIASFKPSDNSNDHFTAELRINLRSREDVECWKSDFEQLSGTNFIVGHTTAQPKRATLVREYVCRRSRKNKINKENDQRRDALKLNSECQSKFDVKIKLDTKNTREKDPFVRDGYLAVVKLSWCHSHTIGDADTDALNKVKVAPSTEATFRSYFEMGMSASDAKTYHKEVLESTPDFNPAVTLCDASVNPKDRVITYLYDTWRKSTQGPQRGAQMLEKFEEKIKELRSEGVDIEFSESPFAAAIVTPIAKRAHQQELSKHVAFVDSSGNCDLDNHSITFLLSISPAGAVPLGFVITKSQSQEAYACGKGRPKQKPFSSIQGATHSGSGRFPNGVKRVVKRQRNFAHNLAKNQPNAKPHGSGH